MWTGNQPGYGDQGGGYMNSPGSQYGSPQQSQEKKARAGVQSLIPCTVAQILSATMDGDRFFVNGVELNQITLIGLVTSVKENPTRIDYEIDDTTGPPLKVKQFYHDDETTSDEDRLVPQREDIYVRIFAHVRDFQGVKNCIANHIAPVVDINEITCHMMEVMHTHLSLIKGPPVTGSGSTGFVPQGGGDGSALNQLNQPNQGLNQQQNQIYEIIRGCVDDQGVSVQMISESLRGMPHKTISNVIEFLSGEGHIYSTIDDEHFKSTDS